MRRPGIFFGKFIGQAGIVARATESILNADAVYVSAASIWEISIKHAVSPLPMSMSGTDTLEEFSVAGFKLLAISAAHAACVDALKAHHRDPFDRILIAQALTEPLRLVTHDAALFAYSDIVLLALKV